jgi:hypothetical protein
MEANRVGGFRGLRTGSFTTHTQIQRTPIVHRTVAASGPFAQPDSSSWPHSYQQGQGQAATRSTPQRQPFSQMDRSYRSGNVSDQSESANEVENMLMSQSRRMNEAGWSGPASTNRAGQRSEFRHISAMLSECRDCGCASEQTTGQVQAGR